MGVLRASRVGAALRALLALHRAALLGDALLKAARHRLRARLQVALDPNLLADLPFLEVGESIAAAWILFFCCLGWPFGLFGSGCLHELVDLFLGRLRAVAELQLIQLLRREPEPSVR